MHICFTALLSHISVLLNMAKIWWWGCWERPRSSWYVFCSFGWEDLDISELYYERRQFRHSSWSLLLVKISASRSIYSAEGGQDEQNNTFTFAILKNWFYWPLVLVDVLLPRGWSPPPLPAGWSTSAPPCVTLVVVRMTLAWCHSLLEFNSSPWWLEIYVPSSTNLVNGFLYAFRISTSK